MDYYLHLTTIHADDTATISHLDGIPGRMAPLYVCEDTTREPSNRPATADHGVIAEWVGTWKKRGITAIPSGLYRLAWTRSERFSKLHGHDVFTLQLLNVPGYEGIRMHAGNDAGDTEGCPLPGLSRAGNKVAQSRAALAILEAAIVPLIQRGDHVFIDIKRAKK
jgi:hypothetical protein